MKVGFFVRSYLVGMIVSSFAFAAPAAVVLQGPASKCFGYPMAVPSGEKDVVVTLAECLADSEDGGLRLVTADRSSAFSIGSEVAPPAENTAEKGQARLAVVRFPSGSVAKAAAPEKASGLVPMAASPLINREGDLLGLTGACDAKAGGCSVASVVSREAREFLSKMTESVWGAEEAAVQGDEHQTCRLFGGRRHGGGFRGGFGGFVYVPAVRVHYVRVQVVQYVHVVHVPAPPPQVVHVHHHHYHAAPPACQPAQPQCPQPSYHPPRRCPQPQQHQAPSYDDDNVSPAPPPENPPQAYVPPPLPVYVGYYTGGSQGAKAELRHAVEREIAATGKQLTERRVGAEMAIAKNSPEDFIYGDHSRLYASVIKESVSRTDGQWVAKRAPRKSADGTLIASDTIRPVPTAQIEFLAYFR